VLVGWNVKAIECQKSKYELVFGFGRAGRSGASGPVVPSSTDGGGTEQLRSLGGREVNSLKEMMWLNCWLIRL
jgi:hypothetical protein